MKRMKKALAFLLMMVMVMALGMTAFAQEVNYSGTDAGNGTISISNPVKGQTYKVYKIFDATVDTTNNGIAYTGAIPSELSEIYTKDNAGNITVASTAKGNDGELTAQAISTIKAWTEKDTVKETATADSDGSMPLTFNKLPYGYYVITTSWGAGTISITSTNPNGTATDKNTPGENGTEKKIVTSRTTNADGTVVETTADKTSVKIGDTVNYKITFNANNVTSSGAIKTSYTIVDTSSGLDIDTSTIKVSIIKANDNNATEQYDGTYAFTAVKDTKNSGKLTITLPWGTAATETTSAKSYYAAPATVTITYTATLTDVSASNTAEVDSDENKPSTSVETAGIKIKKVDATNQKKTLTGAEFDLYLNAVKYNQNHDVVAKNEGETVTKINVKKVTDEGTTYYVVDPNGEDKIVVDENGLATIKGLKTGETYYFLETKAPDGYTLPEESVAVAAGNVANEIKETSITNIVGSTLPSTGGIGTTLFYVIGAICVLGAGVLLVTRRRMASK